MRPVYLAAGMMFADAAVTLLTPLVIGLVTAHLLEQPPPFPFAPSLEHTLLFWIGLILLQASIRYLSTQQLGRAAAEIGAQLRIRAYEHIQSLPIAFFHQREHGDLLSLLGEDIRRISVFLTNSASQIAPHLVTVAGASIIVINIDPAAGMVVLSVVPFVLLVVRQVGKAAKPYSRILAEKQADHASLTEENLRLNPLIKAFTREQQEVHRYNESNQSLLAAEIQHLRISNRIAPLVQAITGMALVALLWVGSLRIQTHALQAAELVSLVIYAFLLFRPLLALGSAYGGFQTARGAAGRLGTLLSEQAEPSGTGKQCLGRLKKEIRFENVGFSYPGRANTLKAVNAVIPAGCICTLEGENGSGKTTLLHLLMRFHEPGTGTISIDETDIRELDLNQLRKAIGYVPQHVTLVTGSIEDNIRYGLPEATHSATLQAAHDARVSDFADKLPDGLQTQIGPGGVRLSGGQKQRIALARALLKDAQILLLDEPTAMFDPHNERTLIEKLPELLEGKTVLLVTHQPVMKEITDLVLTLADGKISSSERPDGPAEKRLE